MNKTDLDLDAIEARAEASTPGPWQKGIAGNCNIVYFDGDDIHGVAGTGADDPDADFIAASRTDVPALVRELREARRERDAYRESNGRVTRELVDLRAALAASEKRCAALESSERAQGAMAHEATARAERAEAACAQMRATVEMLWQECVRVYGPQRTPGLNMATHIVRAVEKALAPSGAGTGWVSPEQHAEVVRERDRYKADHEYLIDVSCALPVGEGTGGIPESILDCAKRVVAQLAEVTAQAAVMREWIVTHGQHREASTFIQDRCEFLVAQREHNKGYRLTEAEPDECDCGLFATVDLPAGKALAERVKLTDEVVSLAREFCACAHGRVCGMCRALAALDAHDKRHG